jgi:hypothetical protein
MDDAGPLRHRALSRTGTSSARSGSRATYDHGKPLSNSPIPVEGCTKPAKYAEWEGCKQTKAPQNPESRQAGPGLSAKPELCRRLPYASQGVRTVPYVPVAGRIGHIGRTDCCQTVVTHALAGPCAETTMVLPLLDAFGLDSEHDSLVVEHGNDLELAAERVHIARHGREARFGLRARAGRHSIGRPLVAWRRSPDWPCDVCGAPQGAARPRRPRARVR